MKIVPAIPILDIKVILISLVEFQSLQLNYKKYNWKSNQKHYSQLSDKLLDSEISSTFQCQRPSLLHNDKFIMDFIEKAEIFNEFFTKRVLMLITKVNAPQFFLKESKLLSTVEFFISDILRIIWNLTLNKAHDQFVMSLFAHH